MSARFSDDIIDEIRERVDIVRLIGEYVPLKRAGRAFKGSCPFHKEKTPSFMVNPERQIFKCFGCGESGNIYTFLMKYEGLSFQHAVERLARLSGVNLPEPDPDSARKRSIRQMMYAVMQEAAGVFHNALTDPMLGAKPRKYLKDRGFDDNFIKRHAIGFAPDSWDYLLTFLTKKKFRYNLIESAGLIIPGKSGQGYYDRFRNRIIFPIREHREGKVVAFGGRALTPDDPAKYLNSPESNIYNKSRVLYGLKDAIPEMRKNREVIVVEGYFDQLSLVECGIRNVVAPCGTALTPEQVRLLKQAALKIYLIFDSDEAGLSATRRALEICLSSGVETIAVPLPEGSDPDDIAQKEGGEGIRDLIEGGLPALDFLIASSRKRHSVQSSRGRRSLVEEMIPFLMAVSNSIDRGAYISRIADLVGVPDSSVLELLRRKSQRSYRPRPGRASEQVNRTENHMDEINPIERDFLMFLLQMPEYVSSFKDRLNPDDLITRSGRMIYSIILEMESEGTKIEISRLMDRIESDRTRKIAGELAMVPEIGIRFRSDNPDDLIESIIRDFRKLIFRRRIEKNKRAIREAEKKGGDVTALLQEQMVLARERIEFQNDQESDH